MQLVRTPVYRQIAAALSDELRRGEFHINERFYSERELAEKYAISRATANKVLSVLITEGLITHKPGRGAFVSGNLMTHDMDKLFSFTQKALAAGRVPQTVVHAFCLMDTQPPYDALGARALYIERQRFVDDVPVIYEKRYMNPAFFGALTEEMCKDSIYAALSRLNVHIAYADQSIRAVMPSRSEQRMLDVKPTFACLCTEGAGYDAEGRLLWMEYTVFRGDQYEFHGRLTAGNDFTGHFKNN